VKGIGYAGNYLTDMKFIDKHLLAVLLVVIAIELIVFLVVFA
jgi:hypothetical protein